MLAKCCQSPLTFRCGAVLPGLPPFLLILLLLLHSHTVGYGPWILLTDNFLPDTPAVLQLDDEKIVLHPGLTQ